MKNLNSGGTKSGKLSEKQFDKMCEWAFKEAEKDKKERTKMSTRIDKYSDYSKDKFEGLFPLLEIVLVVVLGLAWYLLK